MKDIYEKPMGELTFFAPKDDVLEDDWDSDIIWEDMKDPGSFDASNVNGLLP